MEKKQHIVILGAGESGVGSAILAKQKGFDVFVSDMGTVKNKYKDELSSHNIDFEEGQHTESIILKADTVVKSPGIPETVPLVLKLHKNGIPVISEIEFAGRYTNAFIIGITGSNGKTTTTLWIYDILQKAGLDVGLAGNVGHSFARQVALNHHDYYVIELSSFQLDGMFDFKCDIAVITNITPDHLDRYGYEFDNYIRSKFRITQNQTENDFLVISDDKTINKNLKYNSGNAQMLTFSANSVKDSHAFLDQDKIYFNGKNNTFDMLYNKLALPGKHNAANGMAAGIVGDVLRIRKDSIRESLTTFQGVEHRLEPFISVRGVEFMNDSKATNVNSTWYALESMRKNVIWIVGGVDKGNEYTQLDELVSKKVKGIVCLGLNNKTIIDHFEPIVPNIVEAYSMKDAVLSAYKMAKKNSVVLLSPACASFDLFDNYEDRGNQFKMYVREL